MIRSEGIIRLRLQQPLDKLGSTWTLAASYLMCPPPWSRHRSSRTVRYVCVKISAGSLYGWEAPPATRWRVEGRAAVTGWLKSLCSLMGVVLQFEGGSLLAR